MSSRKNPGFKLIIITTKRMAKIKRVKYKLTALTPKTATITENVVRRNKFFCVFSRQLISGSDIGNPPKVNLTTLKSTK